MDGKNPHDGHRGRLRRRFLAEGLDSFEEHEVLEMILQYPIPRIDTNPLAHRLLDRFGSLGGVIDAPVEELKNVEGVGEAAAVFLHLLPGVFRRYVLSKENLSNQVLRDAQEAGLAACSLFVGRTEEAFGILGLDSNRALKFRGIVAEGTRDKVYLYPKDVVRAASACGASKVILTHNHPNGSRTFSPQDKELTKKVNVALDVFGIELVDHIIVCGERSFVSMEQIGLLRQCL